MTKPFWKPTRRLAVLVFVLFGLLWVGCRSPGLIFSEDPVAAYTKGTDSTGTHVLQVGDLVSIHLPDGSPPFEDRIKEDGTITLPLIGSIAVVGKTARELGKQLRENYAKVGIFLPPPHERDLSYDVGGEVKSPGPKAYLGETTVTKAIQAAGGFTDFANKKKVIVLHADGRSEAINLAKVVSPNHDPAVYPEDKIEVPR